MAVVTLLARKRPFLRGAWPARAGGRKGWVTGQTLFLDLGLRLQAVITVTTRTARRFRHVLLRYHSQPGMRTGQVVRERVLVALYAKAVNSCIVPDFVGFDGVVFNVKVPHARAVASLTLCIRLPVLCGMSLHLGDDLHVTEKAGDIYGLILALAPPNPQDRSQHQG